MSTRSLGVILIVCTLIIMIDGFRRLALGSDAPPHNTLTSTAYVIWCIGGICGIVGLIRLNALGSNAVARALGFLPIIGFVASILGDGLYVAGFVTADSSIYIILTSISNLAIMVGMLVVGIITIAAKTWQGWRRFVPLLPIVMFPVGIVIATAVGNPKLGATFALSAWLLLGYVIATAEPVPALPQSATA